MKVFGIFLNDSDGCTYSSEELLELRFNKLDAENWVKDQIKIFEETYNKKVRKKGDKYYLHSKDNFYSVEELEIK